ncbi:hypothetical protein SAMN05444395_104140 [Flavobacterium fryxellicola]|uniref:Uncharacterized protein n=1 Tax=Flavobacterium fryxellicola TaxID=249352 RepID=A0A167WC85_9FLAO|nr:hypothetical protein [Flavobacterium fryxellicola]OAB27219.1 hypothetical protein FBFR_11815 [Flavobacterium fryxellicola]SHN67573.1 hypothetical protein SAMN05444395_104140 [Flavobacterium fryxellicola]
MKRVLSVLVFALFLNSCDDGNLIQEDINFEDVAAQKCASNTIIYKVKDSEALLFDATGIKFPAETSIQELEINSTNRVIYRFYNGTVTAATLCETIPPATPVVTDQWTATGGKIVINTTAIKTRNETENSSKITGYNHNITFKNITFDKGNGIQVYETFAFGDYILSTTVLPFAFTKVLKQCPNSKQLYDKNSSEALILDIDPTLIVNVATPINTPRSGLISDTKNKLTYRLFSGLLTDDYFCNTTYPATPVVLEEWTAVAGVANSSGRIEVTTTSFGNGFKHTVILKNVKMKKGNSDFLLGDNYVYGELLTTN